MAPSSHQKNGQKALLAYLGYFFRGNACWWILIRPPTPIYNKKMVFFIKKRLTGDR
jgi:hypothetical protein